jgi:hypothetical protein
MLLSQGDLWKRLVKHLDGFEKRRNTSEDLEYSSHDGYKEPTIGANHLDFTYSFRYDFLDFGQLAFRLEPKDGTVTVTHVYNVHVADRMDEEAIEFKFSVPFLKYDDETGEYAYTDHVWRHKEAEIPLATNAVSMTYNKGAPTTLLDTDNDRPFKDTSGQDYKFDRNAYSFCVNSQVRAKAALFKEGLEEKSIRERREFLTRTQEDTARFVSDKSDVAVRISTSVPISLIKDTDK